MQYQLRIYTIEPGRMDEFIEVFRKIEPLRRAAGFEVHGPWVDRKHDRFVWVAAYGGADGFDAATQRYYASPERAAITPSPTELIAEIDATMVETI